jgi:hypothetical protein
MKVSEMAETLPPSAPPPSSAPPGAPARHEHFIQLEAARSWKRRHSDDFLKLSPLGMELHHARALREPLTMPLGAIAVALAEVGPARAVPQEGRFPVLRRLTATAVVPKEEGVEGWLWTSAGGSALPSLCEEDEAPNAALVFAQPLGEDVVGRCFEPHFVAALVARSPLGVPAVYGLVMRVEDVLRAQNTFRKFGIANPLTDREVAPTLRRSLPTDRAADPAVIVSDSARAARSVAPPGLG